jgi:Domain of unknown function (DUF4440)
MAVMTTVLLTPQQQLSRLNARFISNYVGNDVAAHDLLLHPRFTYRNGSGARVDRATYLRNWALGFDPAVLPYWDLRDEEIVVEGDVALVSAANRYIELVDAQPVAGMAAYTDTYVREGGVWRCIHAQITPVAQAHWPGDDTILSVYRNGILQPGHRFGVP